MRLSPLSAAVLLLSAPIVTACAHKPPPELQTRIIYPALPPTVCDDVPAPPAIDADDGAWALYQHQRDDAGDDCRDKLAAVHAVVSKWPADPLPANPKEK